MSAQNLAPENKAERIYQKVPRAQVFKAWTDTQELRKWWGPEAQVDARPGGIFTVEFIGRFFKYRMIGEILKIKENESLEFTWKWDSEAKDIPPSTVKVQFLDHEKGTQLKVVHDVSVTRNFCEQGWRDSLVRLADALPYHFDFSKFDLSIYVNASPEKAYAAWAQPRELEKWFIKKASKYTQDLKPIEGDGEFKEGEVYEWDWYGSCGDECGKILAAEPGRRFGFDFGGTSKMGQELRTRVMVTFTAQGEGTQVHLTQDQIADTYRAFNAVYHSCSLGWSIFMLNLKAYLEHGLDLRERDPAKIQATTLNT